MISFAVENKQLNSRIAYALIVIKISICHWNKLTLNLVATAYWLIEWLSAIDCGHVNKSFQIFSDFFVSRRHLFTVATIRCKKFDQEGALHKRKKRITAIHMAMAELTSFLWTTSLNVAPFSIVTFESLLSYIARTFAAKARNTAHRKVVDSIIILLQQMPGKSN